VRAATREVSEATRHPEGEEAGSRRRRRVIAGLVALALAVATALAVWPFGRGGPQTNEGIDNGSPTSLATVIRGSLSSRTSVNGTLTYAGSHSVVNQAAGTLTALPAVGDVIEPGEVLYRVDGDPVVLLEGNVPAYRTLVQGLSGPDVRQLNADLVDLGYATGATLDPASDVFGSETSRALRRLQARVGLEPTGVLLLGQAVFLPSGVRVTEVSGTSGTPAEQGGSVLSATSTARQVSVKLDAAQQGLVEVGDGVRITLPDGATTPGEVSRVGTVATTPSETEDASPTIPVRVTLTHPGSIGQLDQAPVLVSITTDSVEDALVVPVTAIVGKSGGGYAVEVSSGGSRHLVPVELGLFDDVEGMVQVTGSGLHEGDQVVVPSS
jgi:peptidoglycan hydrolase-like protein with peptidoglycan-binding domain